MPAISTNFNAALAALSRRDFKTARAQAETALRGAPDNPQVLQLLGVIEAESGNPARGVEYFKRAITRGGDNTDNRINLAKTLMALDRLDEAAALCTGPIAAASPELRRLNADILKAQGRVAEAVWTYDQITVEQPDDFEAWNNLGNARHDAGDLEAALTALQHARTLNPGSSLVAINIGRVLRSMDRHEEACFVFESAVELAPEDPEPLLELGRALSSIDHQSNALRALGTAARLDPQDPRIFVAIGLAFSDIADLVQAERAFRFAVKAGPTHAPAYVNLGMLLEKANRLEELDKLISLAQSMQVDVDYLRALALAREGQLAEAYDLARTVRENAVDSAIVAQFTGQLADRLNLVDEAYTIFEDMNRAAAQSALGINLDRTAYQRAIAQLSAQTTPEWYARWARPAVSSEPPAPAFLVGFPRSGTTLLDTMLMGHSNTHVLEELPIIEKIADVVGDFDRIADLSVSEIADLRALYFTELAATAPAPAGKLVIDKNPLSMIRIPLIHRLFPDAKIILAMRHPADVVLSCFMQNFKATEAMASFFDLTNASRTYDQIFAYWEKCRAILPLDVHMLRYEALVADTAGEVRPLFDFLGLPWEEDVLDHQKTAMRRGYIRTPSYAQVTERIYSSASGRWARYRAQMNEILPILEPWVTRYGYSLD